EFPIATQRFRSQPRNLARLMGELENTRRKSSSERDASASRGGLKRENTGFGFGGSGFAEENREPGSAVRESRTPNPESRRPALAGFPDGSLDWSVSVSSGSVTCMGWNSIMSVIPTCLS